MSDYDTPEPSGYPADEPYGDPAATAAGWRHPLNIGHLVMGIAFLGLVLIWGLIAADAVVGDDIRWLMPIPWVAAGGAGLVAMVVAARRRS
ncbi:hypothetical protein [Nocardioides coralli]|uniref:hypothetical protein n=1 Tax=Nocardioides coralli TaxID=2872154 RepID=UPI001CA45723|nr:hypothetical protein [Nocardioides coralli]QZY29872.1 hypothetical protein K6T13_04060 [Nocardioides coralli]